MKFQAYFSQEMNVKNDPVGVHPIYSSPKYSPLHHRHHAERTSDVMRRCLPNPPGNCFTGFDDGLLARAEALAAGDVLCSVVKGGHQTHMSTKNDPGYHTHHSSTGINGSMHPSPYASGPPSSRSLSHHGMDHNEFLDQISASIAGSGPPPPPTSIVEAQTMSSPGPHHLQPSFTHIPAAPGHFNPSAAAAAAAAAAHNMVPHNMGMYDLDTDPRELEAFAERFKQRRIKLGVTQADVGRALANLKLPGVGSLSQSTICRFESLTLSHNNMIALKPILAAWLEEAEAAARENRDSAGILNSGDKKRKRTSIAAPEKRSLEAYFAVQPRPSSEKIAAIAEKLDLKKNVVRVWFCNQRQKQKRMKYSAQSR
ncbi:POU domain, class 4, transcription factor 3 [Holothuria leucospilota]|uniref:POU domain protein n=1 Tax=Holothuria leucospilota TaxID=206669 RepID=A0A9Q1GW14_HOLLE|nr:POU domain, class 4, transcription factor 3 [Holothuria leucospilota]